MRVHKILMGLVSGVFVLGVSGCGGGGADSGTVSGSSVRGGGNSGNSGGLACATTIAAKVIGENPRAESPGLAFTASLAGRGTLVTLTGLDGSCALKNSFLQVTADDEFPNDIALVGAGLDLLDPTNPRFQQLSTYFYANKLKDLIIARGGDLSQLSGVALDAHCLNAGGTSSVNNAFYLPASNQVCLGYTTNGGKRLYASDDADVILHEFGHAVSHKLSSTNIMYSTFLESGAIDEGIADYWAHTNTGNASLSEWFLGSIDNIDAGNPDPYYQRVATQNNLYPQSMVAEIHFDSRPWAEALWAIRGALGAAKADQLVVRMLDLLPSTLYFREAVSALQSAALSLGFSGSERAAIDNVLAAKGLLRSDSATGLTLSNKAGHKGVYIIDDHAFSYQVGGNCNGVLDVGETALVMVNVRSAAGAGMIGLGTGTLANGVGSVGSVSLVTGGTIAEYMRMNGAAADFVDVLATSGVFSDDATVAASFLIRGETAGLVNQTLFFTPMGGATVSIPISFTVGSNATRPTNCPGGALENRALWPVP